MRKKIIYKTFYSKAIHLVCICITMATYSYSQIASQITFEKTFGGQQNQTGSCVQQTADGGYLILGTHTGDGASPVGVIQLFKTDSLGDTLWWKGDYNLGDSVNGPLFSWGNNLKQTTDGGYIIVGSTSRIWGNANCHNVLLLKTDNSGNKEWYQTYDSLSSDLQFGSNEEGYDITLSDDGGYIITGKAGSMGTASSEMIILKTDSMGNKLWLKKDTGLAKAEGISIAEAENGNYLILGSTSLTSGSEPLMYLIKTDSSGNKIWGKTYQWWLGDYTTGSKVKINKNKKEYFLLGNGWYTGVQNGEILFIKTDTAGNIIWQKSYKKNDYVTGCDFDTTGNNGFVFTGITTTLNENDMDVYLVKADSSGNMVWNISIGNINNWETGVSIKETTDKGYIIAGSIFKLSTNDTDILLLKTDSMGNIFTGVNELSHYLVEKMHIYPNPFSDCTLITFDKSKKGHFLLIITDIEGKKIKKLDVSSQEQLQLNGKDFDKGIYLFQFSNGEKNIDVKKVIIY